MASAGLPTVYYEPEQHYCDITERGAKKVGVMRSFLRDVLPFKEIVTFGIWLLQIDGDLSRHADALDAEYRPFQ